MASWPRGFKEIARVLEKLVLHISGPRLRARETGGLSMYPWGIDFAPISLTKLRGLARRANGKRPTAVASAITARASMKRDLYAEVSARIVAELEKGAAPWVKPWSATPGANSPCNAVTNWRGIIGRGHAPKISTLRRNCE
jgi:hypothetical protein